MKEFKGTPGPWHVSNEECLLIRDDAGLSIVAKYVGYTNDVEENSNANLIAAAPDLLEALQWAMTKIGGYTQRTKTNIDYCDAVDRARAAIARALGEKK